MVLHERQPGEGVWAALQALGPTLFCRGEPSDGASLAAARAAQVTLPGVSSAPAASVVQAALRRLLPC